MTVSDWTNLANLVGDERERLRSTGSQYLRTELDALLAKCRARVTALRSGRVIP